MLVMIVIYRMNILFLIQDNLRFDFIHENRVNE